MALEQYGIYREEGRRHQRIVYTSALIFNLLNQRLTDYLKEYDLTTGKLNILVAIKHHGKGRGLCQVDISRHLILTPSNMTKMIDKLEKDGLVTRSAMEGDRRVNIVSISKRAEKLVDSLWDGLQVVMKDLVKDLGDNKQEALAALLEEWFEGLVK